MFKINVTSCIDNYLNSMTVLDERILLACGAAAGIGKGVVPRRRCCALPPLAGVALGGPRTVCGGNRAMAAGGPAHHLPVGRPFRRRRDTPSSGTLPWSGAAHA